MMTFAFFLLGCFAGIFTWLYIDRFIPNLQQEIYQNYIELYPENCSRSRILRNVTAKSENSEKSVISHFKRILTANFEKIKRPLN